MRKDAFNRAAAVGCMAVLLFAFSSGLAMAQNTPDAGNGPAEQGTPKAPKTKTSSASGIVLAVVGKTAFSLVDKNGAVSTIQFATDTVFGGKKSAADATTMNAVLAPGMKVKATLSPDGTAMQITSSGLSTKLTIDQIKPFMHCSDNEWSLLRPMIQRVLNLQSISEGNGPIASDKSDASVGGAASAPVPATAALDPLQESQGPLLASVYDPDSILAQLVERLNSYRNARVKAAEELAEARKDLAGVVTQRQESLLVSQGILE